MIGVVLLGSTPRLAHARPTGYGIVTHDMDANRASSMAELGAGFVRISFHPSPCVYQ